MTESAHPQPFEVSIPDGDLRALKGRRAATKWAPDYANEDWRYGVPGDYLREIVEYWMEGYDWRAQEAAMNAFSHFRTTVDGVPIHFVHERGRGPSPIPIVLTHGWPWTFWDFEAVIRPLADPARFGGDPADAFDVVVPSLPGYVFSSPLRTPGVGMVETAGLWVGLMAQLGYERFGAQGGDWGAFVSAQLVS